jgi:hypothetical protein
MMNIKSLKGKTIKDVKQKKKAGFDDEGFLVLYFTDGSQATIVASYGPYTGDSIDEYPSKVCVVEKVCDLEDVERANCPICNDTGSYTTGGSFGGGVTTHKCDCLTAQEEPVCEHPYKFVKQSQDNEYPDYCTKCESYI